VRTISASLFHHHNYHRDRVIEGALTAQNNWVCPLTSNGATINRAQNEMRSIMKPKTKDNLLSLLLDLYSHLSSLVMKITEVEKQEKLNSKLKQTVNWGRTKFQMSANWIKFRWIFYTNCPTAQSLLFMKSLSLKYKHYYVIQLPSSVFYILVYPTALSLCISTEKI